MKFGLILFSCLIGFSWLQLRAQEAAPSAVDLQPKKTNERTSAKPASPSGSPELPELSELDNAFKKTSLGKAADDLRMRIKLRDLENRAVNDPAVISAKAAAKQASTDLEKRQRLREYYNLRYGRMAAEADSSEVKQAIEKSKAEHIALLSQPRVRPGSGESPPPEKEKKRKKRHHGWF